MKKTLLSLALVAFASASVANVNLYSAESSVGSTSVAVSGSTAFTYGNSFTKTNVSSSDDKYVLSADAKQVTYSIPTKFGLNVNFEDANKLAYAFSTEVKHSFDFEHNYSKAVENNEAKGDYVSGAYSHTRDGFNFGSTSLSVSYPMYGTFTLGYKADTAANSNFGGDSDLDNFLSAYKVEGQDYSLNYEIAPSLVDGLDLAVSYATQDSSVRSHIVGLKTSFEIFDNTVALDYSLTVNPEVEYKDNGKDESTRPLLNQVDLSYANTMLEGLEGDVDGALSYLYNKAGNNVLKYSAGLQVKYTEFTFLQPYAGVSYLGSYTTKNGGDDKAAKVYTNTLGTYIGASSSYTYANVTGKVYGEVGYNADLSNTTKVSDKTMNDAKSSSLAYEAGVKFSF